jgi:hypothetical protein
MTSDLDLALRGWRNRETGTMHLSGDCPDFESLDARLIEDAVWVPTQRYASLCPWCFPPLPHESPLRGLR